MSLQPSDIADNFTLAQIEARITSIMSAIAAAEASSLDSFNDTQAQQTTKRQSLSDLNDSLGIWLKAKSVKTGGSSASADVIAAEYNPAWPKI